MANGKHRSPLLAEEDWWTVWFGLFILLVAMILGILTLTGEISTVKVPKLGRWVSNPSDAFYRAEASKIKLDAGTTLALLAEKINAKQAMAVATIESHGDGIRLRLASSRSGERETISLTTLLDGGDAALVFTQLEPDSAGLGARAYLSDVLPSPDVVLGIGWVTVVAERVERIYLALLGTLFAILAVTVGGVRVMGQKPGRYALAFAAIFALAVVSFLLAAQTSSKTYGLCYAAWALAIGLLISNTVGKPGWLKPGIRTEMYIKTGLVLLGAEILFGKILSIGMPGLLVAWVVTPVVLIFMWLFGTRVLKMASKPLVIIIAAATSVCGVSAAIAAAAASRAKQHELTLGVGMTLIFTVLMMVFMPMFVHWVGMDEVLAGAWMGGTIDSTGAVVAAGAFLGPRAETVAAVVKMIQNILIGVVGFCIALFWITSVERVPGAPRPGLVQIWVRFPKFIVGFVAASVIFSFVLTPLFSALFDGNGMQLVETNVIKTVTRCLRGWFFCLAFVSIGLESNFKELSRHMEGGKPMLLYVVGQSFNLLLTLLMAYLAFMVLFPDSI